jgi:hypothetical protein
MTPFAQNKFKITKKTHYQKVLEIANFSSNTILHFIPQL